LQGEKGYGDQTDLFGPSAIESIFQKPPPQEEQQNRTRGLSFLKGLETIPSSPPWPQASKSFPSLGDLGEDPFGGLPVLKEGESHSRQISQASYADEDGSQQGDHQEEADGMFSDGPSSVGSMRSPTGMRARHSAAYSIMSKKSRQSSAQSVNSGDSFSAVYIGKHSTADGGVTYAPIDLSRSQLADQLSKLGISGNSQQSLPPKPSIQDSTCSSESPVKSDDLPEHLLVGTPELPSMGEFVTTKRGGYYEKGSFMRRPLSPSPDKNSMFDTTEDASYDDDGFLKEKPSRSRQVSQQTTNPSEATTAIRRNPKSVPSRGVSDNGSQMQSRSVSTTNKFGAGELDSYDFPEDEFSSILEQDGNDLPSRSPSPDVMPPGSQQPFKFRVESVSEASEADTFRGKRKNSKYSSQSTLSVRKRNSAKRDMRSPLPQIMSEQPSEAEQNYADGKRPPPSPFKNPTPKRRRTLLQPDFVDEENPPLDSLRKSHERVQSAIGKRKDARHGSFMLYAHADVLANRNILRPRNPTPNQRRFEKPEVLIDEASDISFGSSPKMESIQRHLAVPLAPGVSQEAIEAHMVASEIAGFSQHVSLGMSDDSRKRSVTTQDFLDEAMKIMSFIRNKKRPGSDLGNLQESHLEGELDDLAGTELVDDHLPGESFSRPPSREDGKGGWRSRNVHERSPSVMDHLKKYQENDDDSFMGTSVGSRFGQHVQRAASQATHHIETIESDPPGLQMFGSPDQEPGESNSTGDGHPSSRSQTTKTEHSTQTSVGSSMGQTTTSRKSADVATLAPEAVAHLIPEEVAGMTFDKDKSIWVRNKSPRKESYSTQAEEIDASEVPTSEGDPFGNIPDLTFDEEEEQRRLSRQQAMADRSTVNERLLRKHMEFDPTSSRDSYMQRSHSQLPESPSQLGATGLESVVTESPVPPTLPQPARAARKASVEKPGTSHSQESAEHEFDITEGRDHASAAGTRNITLTFSARKTAAKVDARDFVNMPSTPLQPQSAPQHRPLPQPPRMTVTAPSVSTHKSSPLAAVDENNELSFLSTAPRRQVNFSLSIRPGSSVHEQAQATAVVEHSSSPGNAEFTYYMSELSDFTVHQTDERHHTTRPLVRRRRDQGEVEDRFAWGNHLLVKALQDTEAKELYWEDLKEINLSGKGISSLNLLDEMCDRLEKADLSCNRLEQLCGAPSTLRCMDLHNNLLTGLTSWGHLTNLQYLDVSNNKIDSLTGFNCLVHLRELKADNNCITSIDGLYDLDGLLKVSVRNNKVSGTVDFDGFRLNRLESLDLGGNTISEIQGLHCLPVLEELILDGNHLTAFPAPSTMTCPRISYLDLSSNSLTSISLASYFPALKDLNLDRNALAGFALNLGSTTHLHTLSLRAQSLPPCTPFSLPETLPAISSLNLSLNALPTFPTLPKSTSLALHALEVASCGLISFPTHFGLSAPNLRCLNINANALKDLRPLLNIPRLTTLLCAGNRLARLRKTIAVLAKLPHLTCLDLRANPFCVGFYAEAATSCYPTAIENTPESGEAPPSLALSLPWMGTRERDGEYLARLDGDTGLRRRVYEIMVGRACGRVEWVDGLRWNKEEVMVKDEIWERLVALGVLVKK